MDLVAIAVGALHMSHAAQPLAADECEQAEIPQ